MSKWYAFALLVYLAIGMAYGAGMQKHKQRVLVVEVLMLLSIIFVCAAGWVVSQ